MNSRINLYSLVAAFSIPLLVLPATARAGGGSAEGTITGINLDMWAQNTVTVVMPFTTNPDNCTQADGHYVITKDNPYLKEFYSALMSAFLAKKSVSFWLAGCASPYASDSPNKFPVIAAVYIK